MVFLQDRQQFVFIGNKTSTILKSNAGIRQGTIAKPNDFKLSLNDLMFDINNTKYVDDITMSSISTDTNDCSLQSATDHSCSWSENYHTTKLSSTQYDKPVGEVKRSLARHEHRPPNRNKLRKDVGCK